MQISRGLIALFLSACAASAPPAQAPPAQLTPASEAAPAAAEPVATEQPGAASEPLAAPDPRLEADAQSALSLAVARDAPGGAKDTVLGVIERAGLVAIIDAGLGRLFQQLKVSPALKKGRFVGFQITAMHPAWSASSLQIGDVVTALNGMPIERPEQAMAAFESLRQAEQLFVDLLREGVPVTLRFRIE